MHAYEEHGFAHQYFEFAHNDQNISGLVSSFPVILNTIYNVESFVI